MGALPSRKFGLMLGVAFALVAAWRRDVPGVLAVFSVLSAATLATAFARPALLAGPCRLWMKLGDAIHGVVSPVVLGVLYALLFVPAGLLRRLVGGDPLKRRYDPAAASYWTPCEARSRGLEDFRQQF